MNLNDAIGQVAVTAYGRLDAPRVGMSIGFPIHNGIGGKVVVRFNAVSRAVAVEVIANFCMDAIANGRAGIDKERKLRRLIGVSTAHSCNLIDKMSAITGLRHCVFVGQSSPNKRQIGVHPNRRAIYQIKCVAGYVTRTRCVEGRRCKRGLGDR